MAGVVTAAAVLAAPGFVVVLPNRSRVLILFGRYAGTLTEARLWWVNPFTIVWRVIDTAKAVFDWRTSSSS